MAENHNVCLCLCTTNHPSLPDICTYEATDIVRIGKLDVQMCTPCRTKERKVIKELLDGESRLEDGRVVTSTLWAADRIAMVANLTRFGAYPSDVSAFDLGRALGHSLEHCTESSDAMLLGVEILKGIQHQKNGKRS